jgi:adenine phosphoribosyltransferase
VPDFPKAGIVFRDITTLLKDGPALKRAVEQMARPFAGEGVEMVVGAEARGFIMGAAVACSLEAGFVPVRKAPQAPSGSAPQSALPLKDQPRLRRLPAACIEETYELEYGTDALAMHQDAIRPGQKVLMVDDLLATGGTMAACCRMVESLGGKIVGCVFLIELSFLPGREKLRQYKVVSLIDYESE